VADAGQHAVESFIAKWQGVTASELSSSHRLPQLLEMLIVLGRASKQPGGSMSDNKLHMQLSAN
jgi:hypothetical protein